MLFIGKPKGRSKMIFYVYIKYTLPAAAPIPFPKQMAAPCACLTTRTPVKSLPGPLLSSHPILTALRVNETTMPKLPPPPRIAQNRSLWSPSGLASTMEPLASTRVAERRESIVSPIHRAIKPTPPPIVAPMHPTDGALPSVTARPCEAHAASTSQFRAPPPIFTESCRYESEFHTISGARGKRRGFRPGAAARPLHRARVREDFWKKSDNTISCAMAQYYLCNEIHCTTNAIHYTTKSEWIHN